MNAGELHRLARVLRDVAVDSTRSRTEPAPSAGELAVVEDVAANPGSSIGQIAERTGFAQSMVSRIVAAMSERAVFVSEPDTADRRRVLISVAGKAQARAFTQRAAKPVDAALKRRLPDATPAKVAKVAKLLDDLDALFADS